MSLLGIDLGTSGVRAAAFDINGALLAERSIRTPLVRRGKLVEADPDVVRAAAFEAVRAVTRSSEVVRDPVEGLSFSTQGEAVLPVDRQGRALAPAPVSMDGRGAQSASSFSRHFGTRRFQEITGQPLHPMFSLFKITSGESALLRDGVARHVTLDSYVASWLGAECSTDFSMAARTGCFDVNEQSWSAEILAAASELFQTDLGARNFAEPVAPGVTIGGVSQSASRECGLKLGTPIMAGLHDQAASFVGGGGRAGGPSIVSFGSSDCLTTVTPTRVDSLASTGFATYPIADSLWITLAGTAAGGWALDWIADLLQESVDDLFSHLSHEPTPLIVLPYLAGSGTLENNPTARGIIAGLTLGTTRAEISRAFLESTGYELAKISQALQSRGIPPGQIRAVGNGASNRAALQVRASASGVPLVPIDGQTSARGAALIAGVGTGIYSSLDELPEPAMGPVAIPDARHAHWYATQRNRFSDLYQSTLESIHHLTTEMETLK